MDIEDILNDKDRNEDKESDVTIQSTPELPVASVEEIEERAQHSAVDTDQRLEEVRGQIADGIPVTPDKTDMQYAGDVMRHFSQAQKYEWDNDEVATVMAGRYRVMSNVMERLANPRTAKRVNLADAAPALSSILGTMASKEHDASSPASEYNDPEAAQKEADHLRGMFDSSMSKLFPDRKPFRPEAYGVHFNTIRRLLQGTFLEASANNLPSEDDLNRRDIKQILKKIEFVKQWIVEMLSDNTWKDVQEDINSEITDQTQEQMAKGVRAVDILLKMEDYFRGQIDTSKDKYSSTVPVTADNLTEQSADVEQVPIIGQRGELGKEGIFGPLHQQQTVEQVIASVTPEMKQMMLQNIMYDIDLGIRSAEQFSEKNPGGRVNRQNMAHFCGVGVSFGDQRAVYQKIYLAATGELKDPTEIASMPVTEYLKKCFSYDLASDSERAPKLKKYTNALGLPGRV